MKTGRRNWLMGMVPTVTEVAVDAIEQRILPHTPPRRRPPGAVAENRFLSLCTRCDACVEACPHDAVHRYVESAGELARTPVMKPDRRACHMCEGFPCAAACEAGALVVPEERVWKLGRVKVSRDRCFTFMGPECGACRGFCPTERQALTFHGTRPYVDTELCVGCGLCMEACPTRPAALDLLPLEDDD